MAGVVGTAPDTNASMAQAGGQGPLRNVQWGGQRSATECENAPLRKASYHEGDRVTGSPSWLFVLRDSEHTRELASSSMRQAMVIAADRG